MDRIRTILAATDFSAHAELATQRAGLLARDLDAGLELIHVHTGLGPGPIWSDPGGGVLIDESRIVENLRERLETVREALQRKYSITAHAIIQTGTVHRRVHERARDVQADLVVIGATGAGAIARRLFGSRAQTLVRTAQRPVLVVRQPVADAYRRVLVATDFSDDAERAARLGMTLAPEAAFTFLTTLDLPAHHSEPVMGLDETERAARLQAAREHARKQLRALADKHGHEASAILVRDGRAADELPDIAREIDAELLCIGAHGKSRLEAGLLGSTSLHAVAEAPCDVLVAPHRAEDT
ncbi:universal stress protein [Rehaibacterium terrae]|jgi:nucleotide-binding universal stress UspA family protein|uniref:Nucleotide-binding universal stress UspA family protein n=1 Tax=Rehaibacterium terrae TaxID=1341696 RepID=A0A7W7XZH9_9GAMM|nr:universal stress protein [Rehaibacterium terrae]MBB5015312.1 nucleotide-binding universal stress UspA family protein [Rehaibacterium terrae]